LTGFNDISVVTAFVAGLVSFLSPCVLPIATGHITYITGAMIEEELENRKLFALKRTIGFVAGFTVVFMIFGLSFGALGMFLKTHREVLNKASGIFIMAMGLNILGVFKFRLKGKKVRRPYEIKSWLQSVMVGFAFGIGWTPCIGPILGTILFYAGSQADAARGAYLLLIYSLGLSVPFIATSLLVDRISGFWNRMSRYTHILMKLSGILVVAMGAMIFFNKMYLISNLAY
jgi:cytochrome c-type biogenesis protein